MKKVCEELKNKVIKCKKCSLYKTRTYPVIGQGSHQADIMFIGEAPGFYEDKSGVPFCGKAGKVLNELLNVIDVKREDVYIANILKCRPPENRNPNSEEIKACTSYLLEQIEVIKPKIIACLGNFSTKFIMEHFGLGNKVQGISKIHGKIFTAGEEFNLIKIISLYHPAVATYNVNMLNILKADFKSLKIKDNN